MGGLGTLLVRADHLQNPPTQSTAETQDGTPREVKQDGAASVDADRRQAPPGSASPVRAGSSTAAPAVTAPSADTS